MSGPWVPPLLAIPARRVGGLPLRNAVNFSHHLSRDPVRLAHPDDKPLMVAPTATIREVLGLMKDRRKSTALVVKDGKLVGIFDERDALGVMARRDYLEAPIADLMATDVVSVGPQDSVAVAIGAMSKHNFRRLPLVDDRGRALGLVKASGVLHFLVEHFPTLVYNLPPDPHHRPQSAEGA